MRALHRVNEGRYARHPSMVDTLYVGPAPRGKRGGTSGNPVDAIDVARGKAATDARLAGLADEVLIALRASLGRPLDGNDLRRLAERVSWQDLPIMALTVSGKLKEVLRNDRH